MPHYVPNEYSNIFGCHIFTELISNYICTPEIAWIRIRILFKGHFQSHKNPCSVAALLCGNFGSLADFAKNFQQNNAVLLLNSLQVSLWFFCVKKYVLWCGQISTQIYAALLEIFHKSLLIWKIPIKLCSVGKFPQNLLLWKISTKIPHWSWNILLSTLLSYIYVYKMMKSLYIYRF